MTPSDPKQLACTQPTPQAARLHTTVFLCVAIVGTLVAFPLIDWLNFVARWTDADRKHAVIWTGALVLGAAYVAETVWLWFLGTDRLKWLRRACTFVTGFNLLCAQILVLSVTLSTFLLFPLCAGLACGVVVRSAVDALLKQDDRGNPSSVARAGTLVYSTSLYLTIFLMRFNDPCFGFFPPAS